MNPFMVQEKQGTEEEKDREEQEKKEPMEEDKDETEEKMEEEEPGERKKPEEDEEEEKMEGEDEERAEASYLEPEEGEEEGGEEVDPQREEKLLEEDEVGQESHDDMDSEEILRNFVKSDNTSNSGLDCQSFPDLTINSPKDNLSDDENNSHNLNSQTLAYDPYSSEIFNESYNYSTKPEGSTLNYQDEPTESELTSSITDPHDTVILEADEQQEVEEKEAEEEEQEKEDSMDEDVLYAGEVKVDEKEQEIIVEEEEIIMEEKEITTEGGGRAGLGGRQVANKDCRTQYKEVTKVLSLSL